MIVIIITIVIIQHCNTVAIQGTFAHTTSEDELSYKLFQLICF